MPEGSIGGKYKTIEDADKGIAELEATLAKLTSERDLANNKITELSKPKPPAYADEKGFEQHFNGKIDLAGIAQRAMSKKEFDPKDMAAIGELLKEGDPAFIGKVFTELRVGHEVGVIAKAQQSAMAKLGGEKQVNEMMEWHKKHAPDQHENLLKQWNTATAAEDAAKKLFADYTLSKSPRSPGETANTFNGTPPGGFTSAAEIKAARAASQQAHGFDYYKRDTAFLNRLSATPDAIKNAPL